MEFAPADLGFIADPYPVYDELRTHAPLRFDDATQHWLVAQGFDLPSVLVIAGSRGAAAGALRLDYHVDDSPQNCLDVMGAAQAKAILITTGADQMAETARKLGIAILPSIGPGLDLLDQVSIARNNPPLLKRLAAMVGWK